MYAYACLYACMCVCMGMYVTDVCICMCACVCLYVCMGMYVYACMRVSVCVHGCVCLCVRICMCKCVYLCEKGITATPSLSTPARTPLFLFCKSRTALPCAATHSRRYTGSSHSFGYSFPFSLIVLGVRAIVLGFRVRVMVRIRVRVRTRGLGDQNYEVGFETMGTVTQNYGNCIYSDCFSLPWLCCWRVVLRVRRTHIV